jgi:hypothetical protein
MTVVLNVAKDPADQSAPERAQGVFVPEAQASGKGSLARAPEDDALRRCLASGEMKPRTEMVRFVIGPDQAVYPDIAEKLPGHGLWVSATPDAIHLAIKKNLFAKAAKEPARPAPDLADVVTLLLRKRCLEFLGLAKGSGNAVLGEAQTESALRANKLALFLKASDATQKLDNRFATVECDLFTRDELGAAFGYDQIVYAGLCPHKLTQKLKQEITRLRSMMENIRNPQIERNMGIEKGFPPPLMGEG